MEGAWFLVPGGLLLLLALWRFVSLESRRPEEAVVALDAGTLRCQWGQETAAMELSRVKKIEVVLDVMAQPIRLLVFHADEARRLVMPFSAVGFQEVLKALEACLPGFHAERVQDPTIHGPGTVEWTVVWETGS